MTGIVKVLFKRPRKGKPYGFIKSSDGDYYTNEVNDLEIGMKVVFKGDRNEKGFIASNVRCITESDVLV